MLKFLEDNNEVLDMLYELSANPKFSDFRIGVAGSYAMGTNKKGSSIDLVLKLKDGCDESKIGSLSVIESIHSALKSDYSNKLQVIWLDLLEKDEEKLLNFLRTEGIELNPESAYTNIVDKVVWVDEENSEEDKEVNVEEDEEDIISKTLMAWAEEDEEEVSEEEDGE